MHLKIKTPAKINLTLDVLGVRADGYHEIASIMQAISLYDYLNIEIEPAENFIVELSCSNSQIPCDERNLVYKALKLLYRELDLPTYKFNIYIEKNIPTEAGLGGGSANAAGIIWAVNRLLKLNLSEERINDLCSKLGSDVNVCYWGGTCCATSRGEVVKRVSCPKYPLTVIKPIGFGITAKDGYLMFDALKLNSVSDSTERMLKALERNEDISGLINNDLEKAPLAKFEILQELKANYPKSMMTGSGSAFILLGDNFKNTLSKERFQVIPNLEFVDTGIEEV